MAKWITMGASALDTILKVPHLPKADEIVFPISIDQFPGGSTANIAAGLGRLGEEVAFFGKAGDDEAGRIIAESFRADGVDDTYLTIVPGNRSGGAFIAVDTEGERVIYSLGGTTLYESWDQVDTKAFEGLNGLYIGETFAEVGAEAAKLAHEKGAVVFFGPGGIMCGYGMEYLAPVLAETDYLLVNLPEAKTLSGCDDKESAIKTLLAAGVKNLVLTEGRKGSGCYSSDDCCTAESFSVEAVDTTGAGDSFTAGFLSAKLRGLETADCLRFGAACAAQTVQQVGARSALPTRAVVEDFLAKQ